MSTKTSSAVTTVTTSTTAITKVEHIDLTATDAEKQLMKFIAAKEAIKVLEAQKEEAELALRTLLADAQVGIIRGVERFKLANSSNSKIDREALKTGWPEAFEATLVKTPYTFIRNL
jgi:predicted phage-related endonuclease